MEEAPLTKEYEKKLTDLNANCRDLLTAMDELRRELDEAHVSLFGDYPAIGRSLDYHGIEILRTLNNNAYEVLGVHPFSPLTDFRPIENLKKKNKQLGRN
jgi:hypothetical protein